MDDDFDVFQTMTTTPRTFPQMDLVDVENNPVHVASLAASHHLILITLKNVQCPICPQLLRILNIYGLDPNCDSLSDPFTLQEWKIDSIRKRLLLRFDAYFIIICPGTNTQVREIQQNTPFLDYPFIAGEQALTLAKALKVHICDEEIMPAILEVSKGTLSVDPIYIGRGPGHYFHQFLLKRLKEERCNLERRGIICIRDSQEIINQVKRRIQKCLAGNLATAILLSTPGALKTSTQDQLILSPSTINKDAKDDSNVKNKQTKKQRSFADLPLEVLEIIFSSLCNDVPSLVKAAGTCRVFYVAVCNVMILCLRTQMTWVKPALPLQNGMVIWDEAEVTDESLDRWSSNEYGIPFRDLQTRVSAMKDLLLSISQWTNYWSPRRRRTNRK
ncbi:hypothetical protein MFLAVUS_002791 [Mucor flavus]|uniref:F-box domain-containing protein n=1 Tax=Mucor flavus TaxID=439312 RepID=A0ABP9YR89_9FUNG